MAGCLPTDPAGNTPCKCLQLPSYLHQDSMPDNQLSRKCLERLKRFDTCTISNAIERKHVRPRNEGFIIGTSACRFPNLPPVIGYAVTARMRSAMPPVNGSWYYERMDWWRYLASVPAPRIVVVQDADPSPGAGALFGEIHARICRALDCVAYVTNGAVRDLPGIEALGFQLFADSVAVSHAYAHIAEFGERVEIGGLRIHSGDLLHGDLHGIQMVPQEIADDLPSIAEHILLEEQELFRLCSDKDFTVDMLGRALEREKTERLLCD
jgi:4-hydroxy-4-methyl-2-oxoglutarate aldolase